MNVYISPSTLIFENFRGGVRTPGTPFLESAPALFYKMSAKVVAATGSEKNQLKSEI